MKKFIIGYSLLILVSVGLIVTSCGDQKEVKPEPEETNAVVVVEKKEVIKTNYKVSAKTNVSATNEEALPLSIDVTNYMITNYSYTVKVSLISNTLTNKKMMLSTTNRTTDEFAYSITNFVSITYNSNYIATISTNLLSIVTNAFERVMITNQTHFVTNYLSQFSITNVTNLYINNLFWDTETNVAFFESMFATTNIQIIIKKTISFYGNSKELKSTMVFEFDDKDRKILELQKDSEGNTIVSNDFRYYPNGALSRKSSYFGSRLLFYRNENYDRAGKVVRIEYYDDQNTAGAKTYEYNDKGSLKKESKFDDQNQLIYSLEIDYDDQNREIQKVKYGPKGEIKESATYSYDANNMKIQLSYYNEAGVMQFYSPFEVNIFKKD